MKKFFYTVAVVIVTMGAVNLFNELTTYRDIEHIWHHILVIVIGLLISVIDFK